MIKDQKRDKKWEESHKIIDGVDHKICKICNEYYPSTNEYFYVNKSNNIDGLHPYCKPCSVRKSRKRTLEKLEETAEYKRRYYLENREKIIAQVTETNNLNIERRRETSRLWQKRNPEKLKEYRLKRANKNHEITENEWKNCKQYFNNSCAYCGIHEDDHYIVYAGKLKKTDLHKEHVDHEGSNGIENCIPSCQSCNSSKHTAILEEWYNEENERFLEDRLKRIYKWLESDVFNYIENTI